MLEIFIAGVAQGALHCFQCSWHIHTEIFPEGFRPNIFDTEIVTTVGRALCDQYLSVRPSAVKFLISAMAQGALRFSFARDIHTEIFAEEFQDNISVTKIVATVRCALDDPDSDVRCSAVEIFTAALAQGTFHFLHGIFMPKYFQRPCATRYLTLRSLPHLDVQ